ncbi:MAG: hypothetical protein P0Y48_00505 [Candidatus Microbacterium phytovorans]|uniref:Uncharacterized protein n=1 Tax=Candidatus Microbacterium phytovorans TaxID=3121374 RepID=A0AAJ5W3L6_9MICO|nr:hypothetical protein [Microbacterium sp.]WEK13725.1 MAG: hypothetical protein P0Y48_00505 [Microbacterium sp.]
MTAGPADRRHPVTPLDATPAAPAVPASPEIASPRVGLWSERWFRVLTILNTSLVVVSAVVALPGMFGGQGGAAYGLVLLFPVVSVTVGFPAVSLLIIAAAAALSSLCMFHVEQRGVRFLRAMTVWGTIMLTVPSILIAVLWGPGLLGSLW